jgi:hypothetical protein
MLRLLPLADVPPLALDILPLLDPPLDAILSGAHDLTGPLAALKAAMMQ